jgi:hypothetical protein
VERLDSAAARVWPEFRDKGQGERVERYRAQASARVTVGEFDVLGALMTRLAALELVTVAGPWWSLRPGSPVYRAARIAAARDAGARAGDYAAAFGGTLGPVISIADVGQLAGAREPGETSRGRGAAGGTRGGTAPDDPVLDLEPVRQFVLGQVEARFGMLLDPAPR